MPWLQLRIESNRQQAEFIEDALLAAGAVSVTLEDSADQPILEPALGETPLWNETRITGLFDAEIDTAQAISIASSELGHELPQHRWELLEDKDWERAWMDNFKPMAFGQRLWICPSWKEPPQPNAANLMLDPGLAFGTGTHPTTALCLKWLDQQDLTDKIVVDYGCGSGILGIAALLLGAKEVIAVDNDPQALIATQDNAQRNNVHPDQIETYLPQDAPKELEADLVLANILAGPLAELEPVLTKLCRPQGDIILSGILSNQAKTLIDHYQQSFQMDETALNEDWVRLHGKRLGK